MVESAAKVRNRHQEIAFRFFLEYCRERRNNHDLCRMDSIILSRRYRVNRSKIIFEAFEDETVLINLDSGSYYSFPGSGALVWDLISSGRSIGEVIAQLQQQFPDATAEMETSVLDFIGKLVEECLVVEKDAWDLEATAPAKQPPLRKGKESKFEKPCLQKYSDMQDLLLLDPIHEVDEMGWPNALPAGRNAEAVE